MHRSKQIIVAAIIAATHSFYALIFAGIALATQNQDAIDMGNGFLVVILIISTVCLVSAYGVWQNQKWGKVLAIITLGVGALLALPGVIFAPTLLLKLGPSLDVLVAIIVTVLLLQRAQQQSVTV